MAFQESASLAVQDELRNLALKLDAAAHGECTALVKSFAQMYQWGEGRVYRALKKLGWSSGRKPRSDRGTTSQCMKAVTDVCAAGKLGLRKNDKQTMHTPNAVSMLSQNGREFKVGNSRINALLRAHQMNVAAQRNERAHQPTKSLYPNHVHQVDPSLCLVYYLPDGSQHIMRDDEFYKNKLEGLAKIKLKVWRYVLVDHYSNATLLRYYQAKGETQANLFDFLLYCWAKKEGRLMHGVPFILMWDKGSANTSSSIKNALRALDVQTEEHAAGNPRAKGAVENGNNRVECLFESRLRYEPVENIDQLNAAAEGWSNAYNADAIPHYDARLKRKYMAAPAARFAIWQTIRKEQLRILPDEAMCRLHLSSDPITRKVAADLTVSIVHPSTKQREHYDVAHLPGIYIKQEVQVSPLIYGDVQAVVTFKDYKGDDTTHIVNRVVADPVSGFREDAATIGKEFKSRADTVIETAAKAADRAAFPNMDAEEIKKAKAKDAVPFGGLDAHSHLKDVEAPAFMQRPGEAMYIPNRAQPEIKPLSVVAASMRLRNMIGRAVMGEENAWLNAEYKDGVPEEALQEIADRFQGIGVYAAPRLVAVK